MIANSLLEREVGVLCLSGRLCDSLARTHFSLQIASSCLASIRDCDSQKLVLRDVNDSAVLRPNLKIVLLKQHKVILTMHWNSR